MKHFVLYASIQGSKLFNTRIVDTESIAHSTTLCLKSILNPLFAVNAEECWQKELFCIITNLGPHLTTATVEISLIYFLTVHRCTEWTLICKWGGQDNTVYMASWATKNILHRSYEETHGQKCVGKLLDLCWQMTVHLLYLLYNKENQYNTLTFWIPIIYIWRYDKKMYVIHNCTAEHSVLRGLTEGKYCYIYEVYLDTRQW
jgi:hypothetical protein